MFSVQEFHREFFPFESLFYFANSGRRPLIRAMKLQKMTKKMFRSPGRPRPKIATDYYHGTRSAPIVVTQN